MQNTLLRPWFVKDELPRHEDYNHKLEFKNTEEMHKVIKNFGPSHERFRMYLGNYEIGDICSYNSGGFTFGITEKFGNGIFAVLEGIFDACLDITDEKMDEILENGISLEDFIYTISEESVSEETEVEAIITEDPRVCVALLREGYVQVLALKDAVHEDFRENTPNEAVLLVKYSLRDMAEEEDVEVEEPPIPLNTLWFVRDDNERHLDYENRFEVTTVEQLRELINENAEDPNKPSLRMYLGDYEIGAVSDFASEKCFAIEDTKLYFAENIGTRMINLFGKWIGVSYDTMENYLGCGTSIDKFLVDAMRDWFEFVVTDDSKYIWELLHSGYMVLCSVNDLLHEDIKNNQDLRAMYNYDKNIILIKMGLKDVFFDDEEETEDEE